VCPMVNRSESRAAIPVVQLPRLAGSTPHRTSGRNLAKPRPTRRTGYHLRMFGGHCQLERRQGWSGDQDQPCSIRRTEAPHGQVRFHARMSNARRRPCRSRGCRRGGRLLGRDQAGDLCRRRILRREGPQRVPSLSSGQGPHQRTRSPGRHPERIRPTILTP